MIRRFGTTTIALLALSRSALAPPWPAEEHLQENSRTGAEQPKIGRDGNWQPNLYDPDSTRVELMEFILVEQPCCSKYTGPPSKP